MTARATFPPALRAGAARPAAASTSAALPYRSTFNKHPECLAAARKAAATAAAAVVRVAQQPPREASRFSLGRRRALALPRLLPEEKRFARAPAAARTSATSFVPLFIFVSSRPCALLAPFCPSDFLPCSSCAGFPSTFAAATGLAPAFGAYRGEEGSPRKWFSVFFPSPLANASFLPCLSFVLSQRYTLRAPPAHLPCLPDNAVSD